MIWNRGDSFFPNPVGARHSRIDVVGHPKGYFENASPLRPPNGVTKIHDRIELILWLNMRCQQLEIQIGQ